MTAFTPRPSFGVIDDARAVDTAAAFADTASIPAPVIAPAKLGFTPVVVKDAEAAKSWHLGLLGDIEKLWVDNSGKGVSVGVYDSGVQYDHWDLAANYDASKHVVVDGKVYDGDFHPASGPHGTAVAGIIAASRNGAGTVGIAYGATVTGVNIFNPYSEDGALPGIYVNAPDKSKFYAAMAQADQFDVVNHSWGGRGSYGSQSSRRVEGTDDWKMTQAITAVATTGRDGLGTISINAAGNTVIFGLGSLDDQSDSWKSDRHTITVGAYRQDGNSSFYSTTGAHLLISAPSNDYAAMGNKIGIVTTDLLGTPGYNLRAAPGAASDYTDGFGGTSAATPIVTGVVSLMLGANDDLGWRDVSNILAASAKMPVAFTTKQTFVTAVSAIDALGIETGKTYILNSSQFRLGGADSNVNGGRMHFSTDYGYGAVDAYSAVRMAEVWGLFGAAKTSANEVSIDTGRFDVSIVPPNNGQLTDATAFNDFIGTPVEFAFAVAPDIAIEHVDVTLHFQSTFLDFGATMAGVRFKVTAPDGTSAFVDTESAQLSVLDNKGDEQFTFGLAAFRGVESAGTWKIAFESFELPTPIPTTIKGIQFQAFGSAATADDVYSYTDEFFTMTAIAGEKASRIILSDTDGGTDWINAAAVTADVALSLNAGQFTSFGGKTAFTLSRTSAIENAVTGDGNDTLFGNRSDNKLYGMRGNDRLNGNAGNDTLFGGTGRDVFVFDTGGSSGKDRILDWSAGDTIATSKMLRGADTNGRITLGATATLLLDGTTGGDTVELVGRAGAVLQATGKSSDGYWTYAFVDAGKGVATDGVIHEAASPTDLTASGFSPLAAMLAAADIGTHAATDDNAFYLYDAMGDAMTSGVQLYA